MPEPIDIVFLGTGSGIPTLKRGHPAILFHRGADFFLFDCGENAQLGLQKAKISPMKIDRIFVTHWHADHFAGILPMLETLDLEGRDRPLEIYGPEASRFVDAMSAMSYYGFGFEVKAVDIDFKKKQKITDAPDYAIYSIPTKHSVPSVGYMFAEKSHIKINMIKAGKLGLKQGPIMKQLREKGKVRVKGRIVKFSDVAEERPGRSMAYSGDTLVHEPFFRTVRGIDVLIHDGTFMEPSPTRSHASIREVGKMARKYKIKKLIFTHFSRRYRSSSELKAAAKRAFRGAVIAEDSMRIRM